VGQELSLPENLVEMILSLPVILVNYQPKFRFNQMVGQELSLLVILVNYQPKLKFNQMVGQELFLLNLEELEDKRN